MTPAAKVSEIPNFGKKVITVSGQEVLFINIKGSIFAVENECPHQGSPLTAAELDECFDCFDTEDFRIGYAAFLAKQKPKFVGK